MCTFQNKFLLCSCLEGDSKEDEIDWILRRRNSEKSTNSEFVTEIGQRLLPSNIENFDATAYQKLKKEIIEKMDSLEKEQTIQNSEEIKNTTAFILSELNRKDCFDKVTELHDKDILSIKLDQKLGLWVDFLYRKSSWRIAKFNLNEKLYIEIIKGKIKPNT